MIESPASAARRHEQLLLPPSRDTASSKSSEAEDVLTGTRARATTFGLWRSQPKPSPLVPTEKNEKAALVVQRVTRGWVVRHGGGSAMLRAMRRCEDQLRVATPADAATAGTADWLVALDKLPSSHPLHSATRIVLPTPTEVVLSPRTAHLHQAAGRAGGEDADAAYPLLLLPSSTC